MPSDNLKTGTTLKSPIVHLQSENLSNVNHVDLRRALSSQGVAIVALSSPSLNSLSNTIPNVFPTTEFHHLPSVSTPHGPQTDLPLQQTPPRYTALYNPHNSTEARVSVASLFDAAYRFTPLDASHLRCDPVSLDSNPPRPLFWTAWCGRLPSEGITVDSSHLPYDRRVKFDEVFSGMRSLVADQCLLGRNSINMPPNTLIILDNCRFAYSTLEIENTSELQHVAFSLKNSPELDAVLFSASDHAFYKDRSPEDFLEFSQWPMVTKPELVRKAEENFKEIGYGGAGLYFGPSGGSSTKSLAVNGHADRELLALCAMPAPFRGALPAALTEVNEMRLINRDLSIDVGLMRPDTVLANIMVSGIGGRSLEVVFHVFTDAHVTNFPIESRVSDPDLCKFVKHYGVTSIIGMATRLIQFGIYCKRNGHRFESMKSIMYAGESVDEVQFNPIRQLGPEDSEVEIYASYGSSEVGEFSMRYADRYSYMTWDDTMLVELVDEEGNNVPEGEVGRVVVTNLRRKQLPLVRFCQDDLARFIPGTGEFEIVGRHRSQIYRDLGKVRLFWADIVDTVGTILIEAFDGAALYQLWSHDGDRGDNATEISLAVYAAHESEEQLAKVEGEALAALDKLIEGSSAQKRVMRWLGDEELVRAHSHKLRTFVSPEMLTLSASELARCTNAR